MIFQRLHRRASIYVQQIQHYAGRFWFPPFLGFLAALDNFIIVIPNDGILIGSSMLIPKRWFLLALSMAIGSTVGALALAALVELRGLPWVLEIYPGIHESQTWIIAVNLFEKYGLLMVFGVAMIPLAHQPFIILASLAETPYFKLAAVIFSGRLIKFSFMAYVGSHSPRLLPKMWHITRSAK